MIGLVKQVPIFDALDDQHIFQLARAANVLQLEPGQTICKQGEEATTIYAVISGELVTSQSENGFTFKLSYPNCFGESALYPEEELRLRKATVAASSEGAVVAR